MLIEYINGILVLHLTVSNDSILSIMSFDGLRDFEGDAGQVEGLIAVWNID